MSKLLLILISLSFFLTTVGVAQEGLTLEKALADLESSPEDSYLEYVVWQMAKREKKTAEVMAKYPMPIVNLFDDFTSAKDMQKILQRTVYFNSHVVSSKKDDWVDITGLKAPEIPPGAFSEWTGEAKSQSGDLSKYIPLEHYFVQFRSFNSFSQALDLLKNVEKPLILRAGFLNSQEKLEEQLAVSYNPELRPIYNKVITQMAITGSDTFVREGSDVTLLFEYKASLDFLFRQQMSQQFRKATLLAEAESGKKEYLGISYKYCQTPSREVSVFSAYPFPGLHIRSNSEEALFKTIRAIQGQDLEGNKVSNLGESKEYAFARSQFEDFSKEEAFAYLSSSFMHHLHSPQLKLTERHRVVCYNHLKMIDHGARMFQGESKKAPLSIAELSEQKCTPGSFNQGQLVCPSGGVYALDDTLDDTLDDEARGTCSHHGHADFLTPCLELPLTQVMGEEAYAYNLFSKNFVPPFSSLAIRLKLTDDQYQWESVALPLRDTFSGYESVLGKPQHLDISPDNGHSLFKISTSFNKKELLEQAKNNPQILFSEKLEEFLSQGLGDHLTLQFYDDAGSFPLEWVDSLNGVVNQTKEAVEPFTILANFVAQVFFDGSVELSLPVKNAPTVDVFLDKADSFLSILNNNDSFSFATLKLKSPQVVHYLKAKLGAVFPVFQNLPTIWGRLFWQRIDEKIYFTTKLSMLEEGFRQSKVKETLSAHVALSIYPDSWGPLLKKWTSSLEDNPFEKKNLEPSQDKITDLLDEISRIVVSVTFHPYGLRTKITLDRK